ncbi:hypothetical protein PS2_022347 [Malus domestica]
MWMFSSKKKILRPYTFYVAAQKSKLVLLQTCNEYAGGSFGGRVKLRLRNEIILCNAINKIQIGAVPKVTLIL